MILFSHFLPRYGTGTVGTHDSICVMAGAVGSEPTGDVSTRGSPTRPPAAPSGSRCTDLAIALAMCHVLMESGLYDADFVRDHANVTARELAEHLAPYTPEWAEAKSGAPAARIRDLAREFGLTKPGMCISARGAFMHANSVQTQRAIDLLRALSGNVGANGTQLPRPRWTPRSPGRPRTGRRGA